MWTIFFRSIKLISRALPSSMQTLFCKLFKTQWVKRRFRQNNTFFAPLKSYYIIEQKGFQNSLRVNADDDLITFEKIYPPPPPPPRNHFLSKIIKADNSCNHLFCRWFLWCFAWSWCPFLAPAAAAFPLFFSVLAPAAAPPPFCPFFVSFFMLFLKLLVSSYFDLPDNAVKNVFEWYLTPN